MTISAGSSHSKMSWARGRSAGWAAFDLKQRQKQGLEPEVDTDPYPPIPNKITSVPPSENVVMRNGPSTMSFSSVLQPKMDFPILMDNSNSKRQMLIGSSSRTIGNKVVEENNATLAFEKLKELHGWADDSLIGDILAAVNNDFDQASTILKAMVFSSGSEENKTTQHARPSSVIEEYILDKKIEHVEEDFLSENMANLAELSSVPMGCLNDKKREQMDEGLHFENNLSDGTANAKMISRRLMSVPAEPEWEEDDIYLSHRKDAIRMVRSAFQHSRAASNAFVRGDHFSAQQLSLKARGEWKLAERLNAKAADEILSTRNSRNDLWKLDLHGLHAYEAVDALHERLRKIETQMPLNRSVSPKRVKPKVVIVHSPSLESLTCMDMETKADNQYALCSQRQTVLQVITGTGNHSRGQAALPSAVRSFLIENGYRFDEARPGVIAVRPKYCLK